MTDALSTAAHALLDDLAMRFGETPMGQEPKTSTHRLMQALRAALAAPRVDVKPGPNVFQRVRELLDHCDWVLGEDRRLCECRGKELVALCRLLCDCVSMGMTYHEAARKVESEWKGTSALDATERTGPEEKTKGD